VNIRAYTRRNSVHRALNRLAHPWPLYYRAGGISAVVIRKDGTREDLGDISDTYAKRWKADAGA
jgi:hypothetical protein